MNNFLKAVALLCMCAGPVFAQKPTAATTVRAKAAGASESVSETVQRLEHEWVDAAKAANTQKLNAILADDWVGLGFDGERTTKKSWLANLKSGKTKLESFEFGPMDVLVLGNVAVVQGSDVEKGIYAGKDTSGKYIWMDVFVKRGGRWVAVRSQNAKAD